MSVLRLASHYLRDLRHFPEIAPVTFIVIGAATGATGFVSYKLFNTPDVVVNPTKPYSWQQYAKTPSA